MTFTQGHRLLIAIVSAALLSGCGGAGGSSVAPPLSPANGSPVQNTSLDKFAHADLAGGRDVYISSFMGQPGVGEVTVFPAYLKAHNPSPLRVIQHGTARPYGMTVDSTGTLYVANIPQGYGGRYVAEFHPGASSPFRMLTDKMENPNDVAVAADGTVYVEQGQIGDRVGLYVTVFPPGSTTASKTINLHFSGYAFNPGQMAFDKSGNLLVSASADFVPVHIFSITPGTFAVTRLKLDVGKLDGDGLAVDGAGNLYVSGFYDGQIDVFAPGATKPTRIIPYGAMEMTAMPDGTLYASDEHGVDEYAPGGSSPMNVISDYNFGGFGIAVGPNK
jgi:hypothetical protein